MKSILQCNHRSVTNDNRKVLYHFFAPFIGLSNIYARTTQYLTLFKLSSQDWSFGKWHNTVLDFELKIGKREYLHQQVVWGGSARHIIDGSKITSFHSAFSIFISAIKYTVRKNKDIIAFKFTSLTSACLNKF